MEYKGLRRQPSQLRGAQRINEVLDATETLLKVRHFDTITIEDIAKRAQVQVGSLYHFFEGKTAVLLSLLERQLRAEADIFRQAPEDEDRPLGPYLRGLEDRLQAQWAPRLALLDLYFAYQRHPLIWASVLELRARVACDIAAKIRKLYPQLPIRAAKAIGEQIGIVLTVLNDNVSYVNEKAQRRLAKECLDMLSAYVREKARKRRPQ